MHYMVGVSSTSAVECMMRRVTCMGLVGVKQYLDGGVHDEAGDVHGAGLAQPVGSPHRLLQDGRVHGGLQQEHMVRCKRKGQT